MRMQLMLGWCLLPTGDAPARTVINPVQSCSSRRALIVARRVTLNDRQFVTAALLTNLSFSAPVHPPLWFLRSSTSSSILSTALISFILPPCPFYSHFNKNDISDRHPYLFPLKIPVFAGLHLQFLNLIYLHHLLFSSSRPCSLTSIIFHRPSCSLIVISLAAPVIIMYPIDPPTIDHCTLHTLNHIKTVSTALYFQIYWIGFMLAMQMYQLAY